MSIVPVLVLVFAIGVVNGLRTFMPITIISWCATAGWLDLHGSWAGFLGHWAATAVLTALALAELVADKLPRTPSRKRPFGMTARILFGGLSGAVLCTVGGQLTIGQPIVAGAVLGAVGGVVGAFAGYAARTGLVRTLKVPDMPVALLEDAVTILAALFIATRF